MDEPRPKPDFSEDGVDLTLIRWMLSLTPAERLRVLERHINAIERIRELNPSCGSLPPFGFSEPGRPR